MSCISFISLGWRGLTRDPVELIAASDKLGLVLQLQLNGEVLCLMSSFISSDSPRTKIDIDASQAHCSLLYLVNPNRTVGFWIYLRMGGSAPQKQFVWLFILFA